MHYILLAEDGAPDVFLVRQALKEHAVDCGLHVIGDGQAVIDFIDQLDADSTRLCPEVLLLDLHLPRRDGESILKHFRASPRCGNIPVVVLTSSRSFPGFNHVQYFHKSMSLNEFMLLGEVVKSVLAGGAGS